MLYTQEIAFHICSHLSWLYTCGIFALQMWMWIIIVLNTVVKIHGYASAPFPESCSSMLPHHVSGETGAVIQPQTSEPPFYIDYNHGKQGAPITGKEAGTSLLLEACLSL